MKTRVLDSWPILEWMSGREPACGLFEMQLAEAEAGQLRLLMSAINVGEVYCFLRKHRGEALAESWRQSSRTLPATIEVPTADDIWHAASLKGRFPFRTPTLSPRRWRKSTTVRWSLVIPNSDASRGCSWSGSGQASIIKCVSPLFSPSLLPYSCMPGRPSRQTTPSPWTSNTTKPTCFPLATARAWARLPGAGLRN